MRFLSFIHENEGEVNVMDENLGLALLRDLQQQSSQFHSTDEFMQYMKDADIALETVKNILLEDGPPEKVLQRCFHMLIVFYDADWCGALNADLDLDIFTPVWWEDAREGFLARTLFNEFEIPQKFSRWKNALKKKELVVIEDAEAIRDIYPEEYANYQRLDVHSVIGAPYYKGSTGFLVVRNPKRYMQQTLPLVMTSYIVAQANKSIPLYIFQIHLQNLSRDMGINTSISRGELRFSSLLSKNRRSNCIRLFQGELEISGCHQIVIHVSIGMKGSEIPAHTDKLRLRNHLVTGNNRSLELHIVHAAKEGKFAPMLLGIEHGNAADLCHGLQKKYPWHDRLTRKMSSELGLHHGDILDPHSRLEGHQIDDAIHQKHRRTMRQDFLNFIDI